MNNGSVILHEAFRKKFCDIMTLNNIKFYDIEPFSILYLNDGLDYDDSFEQDSSYSVEDDTELEQNIMNDSTEQNIQLTEQDIHKLIEELKNRLHNLLEHRIWYNNRSRGCVFRDLNITYENWLVLDRQSNKQEN